MAEKKSFLVYHAWRQQLSLLTDEQRGQLLMAMIDYSEFGKQPELDDITNMAFSFISMQMDRDMEAYKDKCNTNQENGKKGGRPKKANGNPKNPKNPTVHTETEKTERFLEKPKKPDKDKEEDKDKDINNNTMCKKRANELFERLWKAYPNKRGKGQVSDAKKCKLAEIGEEHMLRAMTRYIEYLKQNDWLRPQNGSTFFNSGYMDYLDENYEKPKDIPRKKSGNAHNFHERSYDFDALEEKYIQKINS